MGTLIGILENVADYISLNGSERLKMDCIEGSLNPNVTLEGEAMKVHYLLTEST